MKKMHYWGYLLAIATVISSCSKGTDIDPNTDENELITTVKMNFTEKGTSTTNTFVVIDPDGAEGPKAISQLDKITLKANKSYDFTITILDETKNPVSDITTGIEAEKNDHLFIYTPSPSSLLSFVITDKDSKGYNVGLKASVTTTAAGTGKLKVQLRHQPGVKDGTPTPGSDDINQTFDVVVN